MRLRSVNSKWESSSPMARLVCDQKDSDALVTIKGQNWGKRTANLHAKRLQKIDNTIIKCLEVKDGVFPQSLGILYKIKGSQVSKNEKSGQQERHFKVQIEGGDQRGGDQHQNYRILISH